MYSFHKVDNIISYTEIYRNNIWVLKRLPILHMYYIETLNFKYRKFDSRALTFFKIINTSALT